MQVLYWFESIRFPALDEIMLLITRFGEETIFLLVALSMLWCVDKRHSYYLLAVGFLGLISNQVLKLSCRIPRPWVLDPQFTIVEKARAAATGYSFPSGHTQTAVGTFGSIAATTRNRAVRIACIVIALLVPVSRMYLGVHTPMDVTVASAMALALILLLHPVAGEKNDCLMPWLLGGMALCAAGFVAFVELFPFPADIDPHNLQSGISSAYKFFGAIAGFIIVYIVDEKWLKFSVKAVWWAQILKVALGLIPVLAVKAGLKAPLNALLGENIGAGVRYGLIVLVAGILWPMTFKWFGRLGHKE